MMRTQRLEELERCISTCSCWAPRYHEDIIWPCIFRCNGAPDSLQHYLCCSHFWSGVGDSCGLHEVDTNADPLLKCCLLQPSPYRAKLIALFSRCYHAIKFVHRDVVQLCVDSRDFQQCRALLYTPNEFKKRQNSRTPRKFLTQTVVELAPESCFLRSFWVPILHQGDTEKCHS